MAEENIKQILEEYKVDTKRHFDEKVQHFDKKVEEVKQHFDVKSKETRRHFDVVGEGLRHEIKLVAEGVSMNTQKIDGLQKDMTVMRGDMEIMKVDIEFIKHELRQKIDRNEFAVLEKRVSMLETKVNQVR